jgi:hypothetical protein
MGLFGGNSKGNFLKANEVSADKRPLLTTGAILIYVNQWTPQTLKIDAGKTSPHQVLSGFWDVENREEALELIRHFLEEGDHEELDAILERYRAGEQGALDEEQREMLKYVEDVIMPGYKWEKVKITKADTAAGNKTVAWDIERAAFIARLAHNCGYISEAEAWSFLADTRRRAELNFARWLEYLMSFVKGRALIMSDEKHGSSMDDIFANGLLLANPKWGDVWNWSPLK